MTKRSVITSLRLCLPLTGLLAMPLAAQMPASGQPAAGLSLIQVLQKLESAGYSDIRAAEMDDGVWEVEASKGGQRVELDVDPKDGRVIRERPD